MNSLKQKFSVDDIVWVNLGKTYGWWPAQVQNDQKVAKLSENILRELGEEFSASSVHDYHKEGSVCVKFFDDDNKEWYKIKEEKRIQKYSCKDKLKLIRNGFKILDETKRKGLGGVNLKLAQFYKDVELAEVLTDNNPQVGYLLAQYEVAEDDNDENVDQSQSQMVKVENQESSTNTTKATPKPKSKSKPQKTKKKDPLHEIKDGNIKKSSTKKKRK